MEVGGRGVRVRRLGGDRAGEIRLTRFLRNGAVTTQEIVETSTARTAVRCEGRHVLMLQDTTIASPEAGLTGLFLHAVLAVDAEDGAVLGLADALFHRRDGKADKALSRVTPFEDLHSARWLAGAQAAARVGAAAARVTVIGDRESDIFEVFAQRPPGVDLLIRARHDRALGDGGRMFARIDASAELGRASLELPAIPGRRARIATLAVRAVKVEPVRPGKGGGGKVWRGGLTLTAVDVREVAPPPGVAPVHWRLVTTHGAKDAAEAFAVAHLYRRRWAIEQLFRTLKTQGFDIEALRIGEDAPRSKLVTAAVVAAVTVQQLVHAREGEAGGPGPLRPVTDAFEETDRPLLRALTARLEGKTARQKNPHPEGSLAYAAWVCARLGGWTGYYGKPGPIVMLHGWLHFQAAKLGAKALNV